MPEIRAFSHSSHPLDGTVTVLEDLPVPEGRLSFLRSVSIPVFIDLHKHY